MKDESDWLKFATGNPKSTRYLATVQNKKRKQIAEAKRGFALDPGSPAPFQTPPPPPWAPAMATQAGFRPPMPPGPPPPMPQPAMAAEDSFDYEARAAEIHAEGWASDDDLEQQGSPISMARRAEAEAAAAREVEPIHVPATVVAAAPAAIGLAAWGAAHIGTQGYTAAGNQSL